MQKGNSPGKRGFEELKVLGKALGKAKGILARDWDILSVIEMNLKWTSLARGVKLWVLITFDSEKKKKKVNN